MNISAQVTATLLQIGTGDLDGIERREISGWGHDLKSAPATAEVGQFLIDTAHGLPTSITAAEASALFAAAGGYSQH